MGRAGAALRRGLVVGGVALLAAAASARTGWVRVAADHAAPLGPLTVVPRTDWNADSGSDRWSGQWTHDGPALDRLEWSVSAAGAQTPFRERRRRRPHRIALPYDPAVTLVDLAALFESSFRAGAGAASYDAERIVPARLAGYPAIEVVYRFSLPGDDLPRRGIARLAIANGALILVNFTAPALHFFPVGEAEVRAIMDGARPDVGSAPDRAGPSSPMP